MFSNNNKVYYPLEQHFSARDIKENWSNWVWQEQNAIQTVSRLFDVFPQLGGEEKRKIVDAEKYLRFKITPYILSMIQVDEKSLPVPNDPVWNQFVPSWDTPDYPPVNIGELQENWELPEEMITPILQHKYANRVNFRIQNTCLAYCMYCFEAKRVLDRNSTKRSFTETYFKESLNYIKRNGEIEEIVISGGEPLTFSNERLDKLLATFREIKKIRAIRIQTRAFVHNPFRIDDEFIRMMVKHDVTAMGVHVSHPVEMTAAFKEAVARFSESGCRTILLAQIPLLKGINDSEQVLVELFMNLYKLKIKPYYLLHAMPHTLGSSKFRTSVRKGVELMKSIKRNISNPAVPEYVIVHARGKHTVPLELSGTPEFQYLNGEVRFLNWKGEWCFYEDVEEP